MWHPQFIENNVSCSCCRLNVNWWWSSLVIKLSFEVDRKGAFGSQHYPPILEPWRSKVWVGGPAFDSVPCWKAPALKHDCIGKFVDLEEFRWTIVCFNFHVGEPKGLPKGSTWCGIKRCVLVLLWPQCKLTFLSFEIGLDYEGRRRTEIYMPGPFHM